MDDRFPTRRHRADCSLIAVFRHYCSRHLICIVPFTRRGPSLHRHYPASLLLFFHHDSSAKFVLAYQTLTHSRSCRLKRIFSPARPLILLDFSTESFNHIALQCSAATMDANSPTHAGAFGLTQRQTEYIKTATISTDRIPPQTSPTTR